MFNGESWAASGLHNARSETLVKFQSRTVRLLADFLCCCTRFICVGPELRQLVSRSEQQFVICDAVPGCPDELSLCRGPAHRCSTVRVGSGGADAREFDTRGVWHPRILVHALCMDDHVSRQAQVRTTNTTALLLLLPFLSAPPPPPVSGTVGSRRSTLLLFFF